MRFFIIFYCLVKSCWATPPTPIVYDSHYKITTWGDRNICEPVFVYQIDPDGIKILFDTTLIETRTDAVALFRILKLRMREIKKLAIQRHKCHPFHSEGINITFKGEVFSIASGDFRCQDMNPKLRLDLQKVYSSIILLNAEMEDQRETHAKLIARSKCYP